MCLSRSEVVVVPEGEVVTAARVGRREQPDRRVMPSDERIGRLGFQPRRWFMR